MDIIREVSDFKLLFDSRNVQSVIVNSNINYYGDFKKGLDAQKEVEFSKKMSDLAFLTFCVGSMKDKYSK